MAVGICEECKVEKAIHGTSKISKRSLCSACFQAEFRGSKPDTTKIERVIKSRSRKCGSILLDMADKYNDILPADILARVTADGNALIASGVTVANPEQAVTVTDKPTVTVTTPVPAPVPTAAPIPSIKDDLVSAFQKLGYNQTQSVQMAYESKGETFDERFKSAMAKEAGIPVTPPKSNVTAPAPATPMTVTKEIPVTPVEPENTVTVTEEIAVTEPSCPVCELPYISMTRMIGRSYRVNHIDRREGMGRNQGRAFQLPGVDGQIYWCDWFDSDEEFEGEDGSLLDTATLNLDRFIESNDDGEFEEEAAEPEPEPAEEPVTPDFTYLSRLRGAELRYVKTIITALRSTPLGFAALENTLKTPKLMKKVRKLEEKGCLQCKDDVWSLTPSFLRYEQEASDRPCPKGGTHYGGHCSVGYCFPAGPPVPALSLEELRAKYPPDKQEPASCNPRKALPCKTCVCVLERDEQNEPVVICGGPAVVTCDCGSWCADNLCITVCEEVSEWYPPEPDPPAPGPEQCSDNSEPAPAEEPEPAHPPCPKCGDEYDAQLGTYPCHLPVDGGEGGYCSVGGLVDYVPSKPWTEEEFQKHDKDVVDPEDSPAPEPLNLAPKTIRHKGLLLVMAEYHNGVNWTRTVDIINALRSGGAQSNDDLVKIFSADVDGFETGYQQVAKITHLLCTHGVIEDVSGMPKGFGRESIWNLTAGFIGSFAAGQSETKAKHKAPVGL